MIRGFHAIHIVVMVAAAASAACNSNELPLNSLSGGSGFGQTSNSSPSPTPIQKSAGSPTVFYTDLTSGPNSGGENNNGSIVSIYGSGFGASQGSSTVTIGAGVAASYLLWSDTHISVAIGSQATTGNIVVHSPEGTSNGVSFTVRSGNIYCVSTSGNDNNAGTFPAQCWASVRHARDQMAAGDITYVKNGVSLTDVDPTSAAFGKPEDYAALLLNNGGATGAPLALVVYPGGNATIGASIADAIEVPNISGNFDHWVIAGFTIRGQAGLVMSSNDMRFVANDISCTGENSWGCIEPGGDSYVFYGNNIHDVGQNCGSNPNTCKLYHAMYFGISNHDDVGWNIVDPDPRHTGIAGCRAIQFHTSDGSNLNDSDIHIHDNIIRDSICDGLNLTTVDPDAGVVEVYNNIIYHVGTGPDPSGVESDYACIYTTSNATPSNAVDVYNNTMYDCGGRGGGGTGSIAATINTRLRNNIFYQLAGEEYLTQDCSNVSGSNNLWYGISGAPQCQTLSANLNANPLFVNLTNFDFHLQAGSPAASGGIVIPSLLYNFDGQSRGLSQKMSIGAY